MAKEFLSKLRMFLSQRGVVLLASVGAIGAAVILGGPGHQALTLGGTEAHAVEVVQPKAGFAI